MIKYFKKPISILLLNFLSILNCFANNNSIKPNLVEKDNEVSCCYDLIIIGGGSGGFAAAAAASKLNKKILLVNEGLPIGGTCINVGCMPSKYLVRAAESVHLASHSPFPGINARAPSVNFSKLIQGKKNFVANSWNRNYSILPDKIKGLTVITGIAKFKNKNIITVKEREFTAKMFIIATGASPNIPEISGLKESGFYTNRNLFNLEKKPPSITIIGSGYIALEIASIYSQLGVKVRLIDRKDRILYKHTTKETSEELEKHLTNIGVEFYHDCIVERVEKKHSKITIHCKERGYKALTLIEKGLIVNATGINANTEGMGLETIKVKVDQKGRIVVNNRMQTSIPNIYAIGDCTNTPNYLYTTVKEAKIAANNAFNNTKQTIEYKSLPWVVFTNPEIAGAGVNEIDAKALGLHYEVVILPLSNIDKTSTSLDKRGMIKLIRNPNNNRIIGGRIIGPNAGELAIQISMAIKYGIKVSDLKTMFYPYLTLSEGIQKAARKFK